MPWLWRQVGHVLRITGGIALILVGLLGIIVPIMPGWSLALVGIVMLAPGTRFSRWLKRTFARLAERIRRKKDGA